MYAAGRSLPLAVFLAVAAAPAGGYEQPAKGPKAQFALVNGYAACVAPNTNVLTNGAGACAPPVPTGTCAFRDDGAGKIMFKRVGSRNAGTQDLAITAAAQGLNGACEGLSLWVELSFRMSTNDCVLGSCTEVDIVDQHLINAGCVVREGKCKISTSLNTAIAGYHFVPSDGKNTGIQILACGLHSSATSLLNPPELPCGMVLK